VEEGSLLAGFAGAVDEVLGCVAGDFVDALLS